MRRIARAAGLIGAVVIVARVVVPKLRLHERLMARCERMFQQMPEDLPPKRMMAGIEEIRATTARTLGLLEEREQAGKGKLPGEVSSPEAVGHRGGAE